MDRFDALSPIDYRYWGPLVAKYLSENAFTRYKALVELALVTALHRRGLCDGDVVNEIGAACEDIKTAEVYEEENRIKHDIRALVNCIRARVSEKAKPYVHMTATSYDIVDTANALRYRAAVTHALVPALKELLAALVAIVEREAETLQVGRTHGQHAVPITFGFAVASHLSRLGFSMEKLTALAEALPGKFSGAVGAYNASYLFFEDPEKFEAEVLAELDLKPAEHSTQIAPPEALIRLLSEVTIAAGVMANLSDDMRNLQRTEIGEVGEAFGDAQVGSSTMPQKRNPVNFENAKSLWKLIAARMQTVYMDQISEHQRDLTGSASSRASVEILGYAVAMAKRLSGTMRKLSVDHESLERNLKFQGDLVLAEPLYLLLAALGHPDAHEKVRSLTLVVEKNRWYLSETIERDDELKPYLARMTEAQRQSISRPKYYTGIAAIRAREVAAAWKAKLGL